MLSVCRHNMCYPYMKKSHPGESTAPGSLPQALWKLKNWNIQLLLIEKKNTIDINIYYPYTWFLISFIWRYLLLNIQWGWQSHSFSFLCCLGGILGNVCRWGRREDEKIFYIEKTSWFHTMVMERDALLSRVQEKQSFFFFLAAGAVLSFWHSAWEQRW